MCVVWEEGGLTCKSFHVSTGGATSHIRLDPFSSFVSCFCFFFLFQFDHTAERRPAVVSVCRST